MFDAVRKYPEAYRPERVGTYPEFVYAGGGYFYDEVLEYRVWVKVPGKDPELHSFATYADALRLSKIDPEAEPPLALVLQREYVDEPSPGEYRHIRKERMAEWQVGWLKGSHNDGTNIESFLRKVGLGNASPRYIKERACLSHPIRAMLVP